MTDATESSSTDAPPPMPEVVEEASSTTNKPSEPEPKKKRTADRQITKDDDEEGSDDDPLKGTFKKASEDTLRQRRIVKVRRPAPSEDDGDKDKPKNPFAAALDQVTTAATTTTATMAKSATTSPAVFGSSSSGFSGFSSQVGKDSSLNFSFGSQAQKEDTANGTVATTNSAIGFGAFGAASSGSAFGSAFGGAATTTPTTSSNSSVFGTGASGTTAPSAFAAFSTNAVTATGASSKPDKAPVVLLPEVDLTNGEEDEECLFFVRAKTFILADIVPEKKIQETQSAALPSVPPSSSTAPAFTDNSKDKEETNKDLEKDVIDADEKAEQDHPPVEEEQNKEKESQNGIAKDKPQEATTKNSDDDENNGEGDKEAKKEKQDWKEVGIGPLRLLKHNTTKLYRLVQRRESTPGASGTKLILNLPITTSCSLTRQSEKYVQLTTIVPPGETAHYLFRVKAVAESEELQNVLQQGIEQAMSEE